jgi:hypothetical protein
MEMLKQTYLQCKLYRTSTIKGKDKTSQWNDYYNFIAGYVIAETLRINSRLT